MATYEDPTGRLQRGVLFAKRCSRCDASHGEMKDGQRIMLSQNMVGGKSVLLCQGCGFELVKRLRTVHKGKKKKRSLKPEDELQVDFFAEPEPEPTPPKKRARRVKS